MPLSLGIGAGLAHGKGGGGPIDTPTIAVVSPVTNPPSFNVGLTVVGPKAVVAGDFVELRIDGGTTYTSSALSAGDILAGTISIANGTLSSGVHTADARIRRGSGGSAIYSAWSASTSYTISTPPTATYVSTGTLTFSTNTFTKTGAGIGSASSTRLVIVAIGGPLASGRSISSATIGGVAATIHVDKQGNSSWAAIISAVVPTETTADIVLTMNLSVFNNAVYAVYTSDTANMSSQTPVTGNGTATAVASLAASSFSASANGFIVAITGSVSSSFKTPASLSDDKSDTFSTDVAFNGNILAGRANAIAGGTTIVTATWTGSFDACIAAASWR